MIAILLAIILDFAALIEGYNALIRSYILRALNEPPHPKERISYLMTLWLC